MERMIQFENFRNLGFKQKEKLVLNYSLEKGKMGNLVIVVGANNSGKSNVLDGLAEFVNLRLSEKDVTTLSFEEADRHPSLTLCAKDGNDIYSYKLTDNRENNIVKYPKPKLDCETVKKEDLQILKYLLEAFKSYSMEDSFQTIKNYDKLVKTENELEIEEIDANLSNIIQTLKANAHRHGGYYSYVWDDVFNKFQNTRQFLNNGSESEETKLKKKFVDKYGIDFFPNIYKYSEKQISDNHLKTTVDRINDSAFFKSVLGIINVNVDEIRNAYNTFYNLGSKGILKDLENKINKKMKTVAKCFNDLYRIEKETYEFEIDLESDSIFFIMKRGEQSIVLDYQSTGFKWFFNLYFNLLCTNTLKAGDIVLMDEPATNLHVKGQQELRVFLKNFAIKNDITIVLATHSPFLIDMDYLDELRVVTMNNNVSCISNDFSTIDTDDPDSLKPIKEALTVANHTLYDPDKKVVFVEGITDYNYMVAFKKKFKNEDIVFLPIRGIGKYGSKEFEDKQKEISKRLIKIKKHSPILMVDGDNAGKSMKKTNNDSALTVFTLTEVKPEFKTIENLFSETDQKDLGLITKDGKYVKHSSKSSLFKSFYINTKTLSRDTEENFKLLFNHIEHL